jgi:Ca-activated chloride channel family protein
MSFLAPGRLWLLLATAALAGVYVLAQLRRSRYAVRFTNLDLLDKIAPSRPGWRRHVSAVLFLVMLVLLTTGFARPTAEVRVPRERATILVVMDNSMSMRATDVAPDRSQVAKQAARTFVDQLPEQFNVGLVVFSGSAAVTVPPTTDRALLRGGIDQLDAQGHGTAIGEAITTALRALAAADPEAADDPPPSHVVLLSDGANTTGRAPQDAAADAAAAGVPVSTIAYGTAEGVVDVNDEQVPVPADGPTLRQVAERSGGSFHEAASGDELRQVYDDIGSSVGYRTERREVAAWFIGFGLLAALGAAAASLAWFSRLP